MEDATERDPNGAEQWIPASMRAGSAAIEPAEPDSDPLWALEDKSSGTLEPMFDEPAPTRSPEEGPPPLSTPPELDGRLRRIETTTDRFQARLEELEQNSAGSSAALDGVGSVQAVLTERIGSLEAAAGDAGGVASSEEDLARTEAELRRLSEQIEGLDSRMTRLEEQTSIVLDEFRERLGIQSERLSEAEQSARERLEVVERGFDAGLAGLRSEIDRMTERGTTVRDELSTLTDAITTRLGELGARVAELAEQRRESMPTRSPPPASQPLPSSSPPSSLDNASFEELRGVGLSVTQAARFIAFRSALGRSLAEPDIDEVAGLQEDLKERLRDLLG